MITACVVTSRPVVGSSAISSAGLAGQRDRDHDALAHAAGHFERIGLGAPRRVGDADGAQHLDGCAGASFRGTLPWRISTSAICRPTGRIGLSAVRGFWKIIAIFAAAHVGKLAWAGVQEIEARASRGRR
jgi:hypothetical protein